MTNWASPSGDREPDRRSGADAPPPAGYRHLGSHPDPSLPARPQYGQYAPGYGPAGGPPPYAGPAGGPAPSAVPYGAVPYGAGPPAYANPMMFAPRPGVIPLRPLVLGDILEGAFRTVRGNPSATIGLALVVSALFAIPTVLATLLISNIAFGATDAGDAVMTLATYAGQLVGALASILLSGMLIVVVAEAVLGHRASIGEAWQRIRPRIWALLAATVLIVLAIVVLAAVLIGLAVVAYLVGGGVAAVVVGIPAALAFICALLWLSTRLSLAPAAITLEGLGPIAGLKRSWALTAKQFWRIFGITMLTQLLVGAIVGVIMVPAVAIAAGVLVASAGPSASGDQMPVGFVIFMQVMTIITTAITAPFTSSVTGLLYLDQRIRREAFDLELMNAAGLK